MYARTAGLAGRALLLLLLAAPLLTQVQQPGASLCLLPFFPLAGSGGLHRPDLGSWTSIPRAWARVVRLLRCPEMKQGSHPGQGCRAGNGPLCCPLLALRAFSGLCRGGLGVQEFCQS